MNGFPLEFALFALTLVAVARSHASQLTIALAGLLAIVLAKLLVTGFAEGPGLAGLFTHLKHKWALLANLLLLLVGFALLARHVEASGLPDAMPAYMPAGPAAGFALLSIVFALSAVLDNIAAALIGGTIANHVYRSKVHIGFVAALVGAANAGGAGSVIGDTTTTMMWISGIDAAALLRAFVPATVTLLVLAVPASLQQHRLMPATHSAKTGIAVDKTRLAVAAAIMAAAAASNVAVSLWAPSMEDAFPVIGAAVMAMVVATAPLRRPDWGIVPEAAKGAAFLLALVLAASLMPVERLPAPSAGTAFGLGVLSAVFDNIPLTALALKQGGYDWALLAYAVGFGGSMLWFGSSAGVAVCGIFPAARSAVAWIKGGWHVPFAYAAGFGTYLVLFGWHGMPLAK